MRLLENDYISIPIGFVAATQRYGRATVYTMKKKIPLRPLLACESALHKGRYGKAMPRNCWLPTLMTK